MVVAQPAAVPSDRDVSGSAQRPAATGALDHLKWPVPARSLDVEHAKDQLLDDEKLGVVIVGEKGVGKSTVANAVMADLGHTYFPLRLRGTLAGASVPYSCLGFLLARLPAEATATPLGILHGVTELLRSDAAGRPVVIVLDNAAALDEGSTGVILHLLLTRTATVIATTRTAADLPPDFHWLLQDGQLAEMKLARLTVKQTGQLLVGVLGGPSSAAVVSALHCASGGNPMLLNALVSEQRGSGNLQLKGAVWALGGPVVHGGGARVEDLFRARWESESADARSIIELLSLARRVPLGRLAAAFDADVLAEMEDQGTIRVDNSSRRWVGLNDPYYGEVVRSWLSVPRSRELFSLYRGLNHPNPTDIDAEDLTAYTSWAFDCGMDVAPGTVVAAAQAALYLFNPQFALRAVDRIDPSDECWPAAQRMQAAAYLMLKEPAKALAALDANSGRRLNSLTGVDYAWHIDLRCRALRELADGDDVLEQIRRARSELNKRPTPDVSGSGRERVAMLAEEVLDLAELEFHAFSGEFQRCIQRAEQGHSDPGRSRDFRFHCGALLVTGWSSVGRESDALELADRLAVSLGNRDMELATAHAYKLRHSYALIFAGHWRKAVQILETMLEANPATIRCTGGAVETVIGVACTFAGKAERALPRLLSAIAQLEAGPTDEMLGLALAATAYSYAQMGNAAEAYEHLDLLADHNGRSSWQTGTLRGFCAAMARQCLGDAAGNSWLETEARRDADQGRYTTAGIQLSALSVDRIPDHIPLMDETGQRRQGPLAELNRLMVSGLRGGDAKLLIQACEIAGTLGLDVAEARCAALAEETALQSGDGMSRTAARIRLERLSRIVPGAPVSAHSEARVLTERELQISRLAAKGMSNRDIATELGVSVRTIEGHLYQTFTKLGVSSRTDLVGLL